VTAPAPSERDLAVLRSFARRIDASDAGAHNNLGVVYYRKGLIEEAIAEFTRALELDPKMQVAQRNLEIAYHNTGFYDRRVAELQERLRQAPDEREARWELGRAYAILGQDQEAIAEFEELLAKRPGDIGAIIQLGLAEKNRGRVEVATEWFIRACELDPTSSVAQFYLAEVYYNRGLNADALAALDRAISLNPDNANAHYLRAFVLGDMGRHQDARAASKRAIQLNPPLARAQTNLSLERYTAEHKARELRARETPELTIIEGNALAHYNLGLAFRQKGYYNEALHEYRLALERGEDRRLALQAMAEIHLLKRDLPAARELYETLLRESPDSPKLWNERGVVLQQGGQPDEALASYQQAVQVDPKYGLGWNNLGVLLVHRGETEQAIEAFRTALQCQSTLSAARLNLALLLFQLRRFQLSLEAYRQVLTSEPSSAATWNGIGLVLIELKRFTDARNAFVRAIEGDAEHAGAHYNLSFTLSNLGDYDGALRATKRALELDPYYVSQKFALTIDLQFEKGTIGVAPEISADVLAETLGETFSFDQRLLDNIFQELAPPAAAARDTAQRAEDPLALARDYLSKGLMEMAASEAARAVQRGADRGDAAVLLGDIFARRGLHGEALERYREARALDPARPDALLGEVRALLALERLDEAAALAEQLLGLTPDDVEALVAVAKCRAAAGDAGGALTALQQAQTRAPARADLRKLQGDVAVKVGDPGGALTAYRSALELDPGYVQAWLELGRLHELKEGGCRRSRHTSRRSAPSLRRRAAPGRSVAPRGAGAPCRHPLATMLEQDPMISRRCCCWAGRCSMTSGTRRRSRRSAAPSSSTPIRWKRCSSLASRSPASIATATRWRRGSG
jgi:tetratricopeptide (TPR) repeat protein